MRRNMGGADRTIRIVAGAGIIIWGFVAGSWWGAVGLVPVLTGVVGSCPAYLPFGGSTCRAAADQR